MAAPVGGGNLVLDQGVHRGGVGNAQQGFGKAHQGHAFVGGKAVFGKEHLHQAGFGGVADLGDELGCLVGYRSAGFGGECGIGQVLRDEGRLIRE